MSAPLKLTPTEWRPPVGVHCSFYVRTKLSGEPTYRFDHVWLPRTWAADGALYTAHPPAVGDLIYLDGNTIHGNFRVVERDWMHPQYGSAHWPIGEPYPNEGPMMQVIVETAEGPFVGQVVEPDQEDDAEEVMRR